MTVNQLVQDLRAAAQVVRDKGWCTGTYQDTDGQVCAEGALRVAVFGSWPQPKDYNQTPEHARVRSAELAVERYLIARDDLPEVQFLCTWNDNQAESGDQVAELFETVAAELAGAS